jgi:hypothetical protein
MLTEIKHTRQIPNEGYRRWFTDEFFDLIVWYLKGKIDGFQLCYDKGEKERAITWRSSMGYSHDKIDDGERVFYNKMTPILIANGTFERDIIAEKFRRAATHMDKEIVSFVYKILKDYPS